MPQENGPYKANIMIVDDEPNNIESLLRIFRLSGYQICTATNGKDALEQLDKQAFDLILMDVMMPVMNGYQACEAIKKNPEYTHIPVVFLTAFYDPENVLKGLELGAIDYIVKPFMAREVLTRVKNYVALKKAQDQLTAYNHQLENILKERTRSLIMTERQAAVSLSIQGILHNLKNPLTGIVGGVDIISDILDTYRQAMPDDPAARLEVCERVITKIENNKKMIGKASERLLDMINSIMVKGRKDRQAETEVLDLNALINQEKEYFDADNAVHLDVRYSIQTDASELYCRAIPVEVAQILHNLVKNALDAMYDHTEKPRVTVSTGADKESVWFEVADNGPGIPEKIKAHLFEPFYSSKQAENQETTKAKGTGLGLYSCWELAHSNDGDIQLLESMPGKTVFRVTFPQVDLV